MLAGCASAELTRTHLRSFFTDSFSFSVSNYLCLHIGISWSIKETASSSTSSLEGRESSLQKGSSSYAAFPKQVSSYSLSSLFKGEVLHIQCGQMGLPSRGARVTSYESFSLKCIAKQGRLLNSQKLETILCRRLHGFVVWEGALEFMAS